MPRLTQEQIEARRSFIGASDIGAIAGFNPYKDAFDVLNEKLGFTEEGPDEQNDAAEWGHRLEPLIRGAYVTDQQVTLIPCGTVSHPTEAWAGATLDSKIVGTRRGLEIKAVGFRTRLDWNPTEDDGIPHYVRCQAAWQMWVVDLDEVDVAALLCSTEFRIWRTPRDRELEALLVGLGRKFYTDYVLEKRTPPLTGGDAVRQYLDHKYPPPPAPVPVPADETIASVVRAREAFKGARDAAEAGYKQTTQEVIAWLGEHNATDAIGDDFEFRYRVRKDGSRQPWCKMKGDKP